MDKNIIKHMQLSCQKQILFIFVTVILAAAVSSPLWAYRDELNKNGIHCAVEGAWIERIENNLVVLKMLAPQSSITLRSQNSKQQRVVIKLKNINPPRFQIKSQQSRIQYNGKNYSMIEADFSKGNTVSIEAEHLIKHNSFTFAMIGDPQGRMDRYKTMLDKIAKSGSLFTIVLGDLVEEGYPEDYAKYLKTVVDFPQPLYYVPGNHDTTFGGRKIFERDISPADYTFEAGKFNFIMLDSSRWHLLEEQWTWLESRLQAHKNNLVFMHVPPFSPLQRLDDYTMSYREQTERFTSLMEKYKVKAVFSGHIHGFQKEKRNGVKYYISGGGGALLHLFPWEGGYFHYLLVTVRGNKLNVKVVR